MEVIRAYPENMDKRMSYNLMNSNETHKMSDAEGSVLQVKAWVIYEDEDPRTHEVKKVCSIQTADDEIFGTISPTFIREFEKIVNFFGGDVGDIKVISGTSKNGRTFITCDIAW